VTAPLRFAVIGDPVAHSRSPAMHRAAFAALGLPHTYDAVRVEAPELRAVVAQLRGGVYAGLNVTVPHKQRVLEHVDDVAGSAQRVGAANTLVREDAGGVTAHNTDVPALEAELQELLGPGAAWSSLRGLVLGSGGAARAAVAALASLGVGEIVVRARRRVDFAPLAVGAWQPWQPSAASEAATAIVVQATSAGMAGADPGEHAAEAVAWDALPADAVALDVVYGAGDTPFIARAKRRGLRAGGGLGMLARQGALALELWLGVVAPLAAMRAALGAGH
jgi:shikimate dehydrogenase